MKSLNLSYDCLISVEVQQAIIGLCLSNPVLYEEIIKPPASTTTTPPPDGDYPEDKGCTDEDAGLFDSLLSVEDVISQILDLPNTQVPTDIYDLEDEVDGYVPLES